MARIKMVMVIAKSLSGSGHRLIRVRPKQSEKLEFLYQDPKVGVTCLYREWKKIRSFTYAGGK